MKYNKVKIIMFKKKATLRKSGFYIINNLIDIIM